MRTLLLALAAPLLMAACASAGPRVTNNPCDDPQYRALKAQPVDSLSEREYAQLQEGNAACEEITRLLAGTSSSSTAAPRRPERLDTEAYTRAMDNELGHEIYVRNTSTVPLMVTTLTVTNCVGVRDVCGTTYPRVRINPGDARRVGRVRYREDTPSGTFRYSYQVEPLTP